MCKKEVVVIFNVRSRYFLDVLRRTKKNSARMVGVPTADCSLCYDTIRQAVECSCISLLIASCLMGLYESHTLYGFGRTGEVNQYPVSLVYYRELKNLHKLWYVRNVGRFQPSGTKRQFHNIHTLTKIYTLSGLESLSRFFTYDKKFYNWKKNTLLHKRMLVCQI